MCISRKAVRDVSDTIREITWGVIMEIGKQLQLYFWYYTINNLAETQNYIMNDFSLNRFF